MSRAYGYDLPPPPLLRSPAESGKGEGDDGTGLSYLGNVDGILIRPGYFAGIHLARSTCPMVRNQGVIAFVPGVQGCDLDTRVSRTRFGEPDRLKSRELYRHCSSGSRITAPAIESLAKIESMNIYLPIGERYTLALLHSYCDNCTIFIFTHMCRLSIKKIVSLKYFTINSPSEFSFFFFKRTLNKTFDVIVFENER